ncbi:Holliday junction resolvase RuvX [Phycicoccus sp. CSK15P-2]|uniref:Holliday junction resolvase RuvX n=1 Tax=Phycicoccus sp. CSK15P-2 TaxID=2807627 RepID=UPI0019508B7B|nr:Holliday junction resolvase RuvX [Phycicoccus sp. CSK15P-2]MBM6403727.1 Holliday junction resolvase RuvX [Phycicoccus sp. CSK15P-2]
MTGVPQALGRGPRLGVDVGTVRVGVAVSDPDGVLATPVETVARTSVEDPVPGDSDVERIAALVAEYGALRVVVGLPRSLSGDEGPSAQRARTYARVLAERVAPTEVRLVDERLTTVDAHRSLRDSGVAGRRQRAVVDQAAAVLILQAALDAERVTGSPAGDPVGQRRRRTRRTKGTWT